MTNAMKATTGQAITRSPAQLVPLIKQALADAEQAAQQAAEPYRQRISDLLAEARDSFDTYADFLSWVYRHFKIKKSQAANYLSHGRYEKNRSAHERSYATAGEYRAAREPAHAERPTSGFVRREWTAPVDQIAERARREQARLAEELTRKQEREAERTLALRMIDIGYKVLAKELHPDRGGSRDAMARLNKARDRLKTLA